MGALQGLHIRADRTSNGPSTHANLRHAAEVDAERDLATSLRIQEIIGQALAEN